LESLSWEQLLSVSENVWIKELIMNNKRLIVIFFILALIVIFGGYFGVRALLIQKDTVIFASGTIEAIEITISPETGGKVADVPVDEGAVVKTGDVLFRLDQSLFQAQRAVSAATLDISRASASTAEAALATSQANYNLALIAARLESASIRTNDWTSEFGSTTTRSEDIVAALNEVNDALSARDKAYGSLSALLSEPASSDFAVSESTLLDSQSAFMIAENVLQRAKLTTNTLLNDAAQLAYDDAKSKLDEAQAAYDKLKVSTPAQSILITRADLAVAQERYESAQDRLLTLQTGENSPKVAVAQATLHQAEAAADQASMAVTQAKASLALIDLQISKLTIFAPADGIILTRSIQPGEIVTPGAETMVLGRLDNLAITVYVPENLYGELSLGQSAIVTVDSFPGMRFSATVSHISDQAEFTPRNVQTVEGRSSTVFAVRLQIQDASGSLKPGMPADVVFEK
jgi:HlyD family secretion protein